MTVWQIWLSRDGFEGTTCVKSDAGELDVNGDPMILQHEFEVNGSDGGFAHGLDAFAYADKWNHDIGEWPDNCRPLDKNVKSC